MENRLNFLADFKNITDVSTPETLESNSPQETRFYIEIAKNEKKVYQCIAPDCGKIYRFKSEIDRHTVMHQNERPYSCTFNGCTKNFKRQETLDDHMRLHEGSFPFVCEKNGCGRRFASKPALRYHKLLHKNNRKFKCDIEGCDKTFLTISQLKQHQRAPVLHKGVLDLSENEPYKIFKSESEIYWEMRTQERNKLSAEENAKEDYEMIRDILEENRRLKEKLLEYENEKAKLSPPEEKEIPFDFENANLSLNLDEAEPSSFFDSYELKLLDFLKDKSKNDF